MSTRKSYLDVETLRRRIAYVTQRICIEEGIGDVTVEVHVDTSTHVVHIAVEDQSHIDGTDPRWEELRQTKWGDN